MFKASKPFALLSSSSWNLVITKAPASGPETANSTDQDEDLTAQPGKKNYNNAFDALQYLWNLVAGCYCHTSDSDGGVMTSENKSSHQSYPSDRTWGDVCDV
jgi:hypothetical protein